MPKLAVHAVIHPIDVRHVLVSVEDEAGGPVGLDVADIGVRLWASRQYTVLFVSPIPIVELNPLVVGQGQLGYFYELRLGDPPVYNEDGEPQAAQPLESYAPAVYRISIDHAGSHGHAIAVTAS